MFEYVSRDFAELTLVDGLDISEISNGSSCIGMLSFAGACDRAFVLDAQDIADITFKRFIGRSISLELEEKIGFCLT